MRKVLESNAKFHNGGLECMKKPKTPFNDLSVHVTIEIKKKTFTVTLLENC